MQINLTGHHIELTDSLRDYVNEKMARLERHFDKVSNTHVILTVDKLRHKAEATVHKRHIINQVKNNYIISIDWDFSTMKVNPQGIGIYDQLIFQYKLYSQS